MPVPDSAGCIVRLLDQGVLRAAEGQNVAALIRIITLQRSQHDIPASAKQWHLKTTRESNKTSKGLEIIILSGTKNSSTMDKYIKESV